MCNNNTVKKTLVINSADRNSGNSNNYVIKFPSAMKNVKGVKLLSVQLPNTIYNITTSNNGLAFTLGSTLYTFTISPGAYTASTLANIIQTGMTNQVANSWNVSLDTTSLKTVITGTSAFVLNLSNAISTMNAILGFGTTDTSSATIQTSTNCFNLGIPTPLYIDIDELGRNISSSDKSLHTFVIQMTQNSTSFANYRTMSDFRQMDNEQFGGLQQFSISLRQRNNLLVDLNNADWNMIIEFDVAL